MTVKNYLVSAVRPIRDGWHLEKNQDLYRAYDQMYHMSVASYRKFVAEPFEAVCWQEPVANNDEYTEANWQAIKQLWHSEPCNIFWAGADTFMTQTTSLFGGRFQEYRMFNYTDPRQYREFQHHFNDDVQYYPHSMTAETWALGEQYWQQREGHPDRYWGFDQLRHNAMFWSQPIADTDRLHPNLNFMCHNLRSTDPQAIAATEQWNSGCPLSQAQILHFCASRGSQQVIAIMQDLCQQLDIQYE